MNSTASDAAENLAEAGRDAAGQFRRRGAETRGFAAGELRAFLADVEELVKRVANVSDAEVARARVKVANALTDMRRVASDTADGLRERARVAVDATDEYVRDRPWTAIGIAAALGLAVGVGVQRREPRSRLTGTGRQQLLSTLELLPRLLHAVARHLFAYGELLCEEAVEAVRRARRRMVGALVALRGRRDGAGDGMPVGDRGHLEWPGSTDRRGGAVHRLCTDRTHRRGVRGRRTIAWSAIRAASGRMARGSAAARPTGSDAGRSARGDGRPRCRTRLSSASSASASACGTRARSCSCWRTR